MSKLNGRIVVAGAGSIGCYVGGCLALAGRDVTFLGRGRTVQALRSHGLHITDLEGRDRSLPPTAVQAGEDPAKVLADAALVLVTVKSGATAEMTALIDRFAPPDSIVVSLQNGVENADRIRRAMKTPRSVLTGMVPFNVVLTDTENASWRAHRASGGSVLVERDAADVAAYLNVDGLPVQDHDDMKAVQWGKLLLNLNNALNALSDLPLVQELSDRRWRLLLATQMDEALAAMRAADVKPAKLAGVSPHMLPTILRLPNWLFRILARRMLAIDAEARSSMWEDFTRHRMTEIDELQGAVLRLSAASGTAIPLTERIVAEVHKAERSNQGPPGLDPAIFAR